MAALPRIPDDPDQKNFSMYDLGKGFKMNVAQGESALKGYVFKHQGKWIDVPAANSYTHAYIVDNDSKVTEDMGMEGHLAVSYGPMISGEGAGRYLSKQLSTKKKITVIYRTVHTLFVRQLHEAELADELSTMAKEDIEQKFGTKYVDGVVYGAMLQVKYHLTTDTEDSMDSLTASLKGKIGVGLLAIDFSAEFSKSSESRSTSVDQSIEVVAVGVNVECSAAPSPADVYNIVEKFNHEVKALRDRAKLAWKDEKEGGGQGLSVLEQISPITLTLASVAEVLKSYSTIEMEAFDIKMKAFAKIFHKTLFWIAKLDSAQAEFERSYGSSARRRSTWVAPHGVAVAEKMKILMDTMQECLDWRRKSLKDIINDELPDANIVGYGAEYHVLHGLCGGGYVSFDGDTNEDFWEGYVVNGKAFANGFRQYGDATDTYKGEFKNNQRYGQGTHIKDGETYVGQWKADLRFGDGKLSARNGTTYQGQFKEGYFHGYGVLKRLDGSTYTGQFQDSQFHGQGHLVGSIGQAYEEYDGHWEKNKRHGWARICKYASGGYAGYEYSGDYKDDKCHGNGTMRKPNGDGAQSGIWNNDKFETDLEAERKRADEARLQEQLAHNRARQEFERATSVNGMIAAIEFLRKAHVPQQEILAASRKTEVIAIEAFEKYRMAANWRGMKGAIADMKTAGVGAQQVAVSGRAFSDFLTQKHDQLEATKPSCWARHGREELAKWQKETDWLEIDAEQKAAAKEYIHNT